MSCVEFDRKNKLWNTCSIPLTYNPNISIAHILLKSLEWNGSKIAQINDDTGERNTFEELRLKTIRVAQNLQNRGLKPKQVVAIKAPDLPNLAPMIFAPICLGCPVLNMPRPSKRMLSITKPSVLFCGIDDYDNFISCLNELELQTKVYTFISTKCDSEAAESLLEETGTEADFVPVETDGINDTAVIMSTSGTTGHSKGACLSHAGLLSEIEANMSFYANGIAFNPNAQCCISGSLTLLLSTIGGATRIINTEDFSLEMEFRIIEKYRVTVVENDSYDVLSMIKSGILSKSDLSSVKHFIIGGCRIPFWMREKLNSYLANGNVHNEYGLVELGGIAMDFPFFTKKDTVGRLLNGFIIRIVDENGDICGINVTGELRVKSRYKFLGYYNNEELTKAAYDSEGFFKTGDIGHIDEDGYVYITDRKKDVIDNILGWVFPSEVEEFLIKSPEIEDVCVVGVPFDEASEVPAAVVVRANGATITEEEICKIVENNMLDHCKLRGGVLFTDSIPVSERGKTLRVNVKKMASKWYEAKMQNE